MSEEIKQDLDQVLEGLRDELADKPQGYVTEISVAERLFPEMEPPRIQVVLLDPEEGKAAIRRVSGPLQGKESQSGMWEGSKKSSRMPVPGRWNRRKTKAS
jgi:hypothetical protein